MRTDGRSNSIVTFVLILNDVVESFQQKGHVCMVTLCGIEKLR